MPVERMVQIYIRPSCDLQQVAVAVELARIATVRNVPAGIIIVREEQPVPGHVIENMFGIGLYYRGFTREQAFGQVDFRAIKNQFDDQFDPENPDNWGLETAWQGIATMFEETSEERHAIEMLVRRLIERISERL